MRHFASFDYVIINDDFNKAVHDLEAIITANRLETLQQSSRHQQLIENLITLNRE